MNSLDSDQTSAAMPKEASHTMAGGVTNAKNCRVAGSTITRRKASAIDHASRSRDGVSGPTMIDSTRPVPAVPPLGQSIGRVRSPETMPLPWP